MTNHELIELALEQLIEEFKRSPESFSYYDNQYTPNRQFEPTIFWQPKIQLKDDLMNDPNDMGRSVIICIRSLTKEMSCYVFSRYLSDIKAAEASTPDASMIAHARFFETYRSMFRKFRKLRNMIMKRDKERDNEKFLKKLCKVLPATFDDHLLGD